MRFFIYSLYAFLALLSTTSGVTIEEPDALDKLDELGYQVKTNGAEWKISRDGIVINKFLVDGFLEQLTISDAWNALDKQPRLRMRDIMALVWARAGLTLDELDTIRILRIDNDETTKAIEETRKAIGTQAREFVIERDDVGWNEITDSPFYLSVAKLCAEKHEEMKGRSVVAIKVQSSSGRLDTMYIKIDNQLSN
ncbi:hypothetical protein LZ30DRAFT_744200 [Colletotrichum cereale]|nr:hypothetical protein LZ30DRAFT_744200 [Colletotrichum cereale]